MAETFRRTLLGGGAKSSEGYAVRFNSRTSVEYRDATGVVLIGAEPTLEGLTLYPDQMSVRSGAPPLEEPVFRNEIMSRVRRVASFVGLPIES